MVKTSIKDPQNEEILDDRCAVGTCEGGWYLPTWRSVTATTIDHKKALQIRILSVMRAMRVDADDTLCCPNPRGGRFRIWPSATSVPVLFKATLKLLQADAAPRDLPTVLAH